MKTSNITICGKHLAKVESNHFRNDAFTYSVMTFFAPNIIMTLLSISNVQKFVARLHS